MTDVLLGVDIGTSSTKGVITRADGIDTRAQEELDELVERYGAEAIVERSLSHISHRSIGPKLMWLQNNQPGRPRRDRRADDEPHARAPGPGDARGDRVRRADDLRRAARGRRATACSPRPPRSRRRHDDVGGVRRDGRAQHGAARPLPPAPRALRQALPGDDRAGPRAGRHPGRGGARARGRARRRGDPSLRKGGIE